MPTLYTIPRARSCEHCATAKAKCEPDIGSTRCKRCNKNNIDCVLKAPRKRQKKTHTFEQDDIDGDSAGSTVQGSPNDGESLTIPARLVEVQRGIEYYRRSLFQWFPFILPPDLRQPVVEFVKSKPFFALTIAMLGCTQDRVRQRELAVKSRSWLGTHVLQKGEKSLNILQGILLATHWYTFQSELSSQRTLFMHLAMSMIVDLGLFKSPHARRRIMTEEEAADVSKLGTRTAIEHTLEEKRALLGCLYLASAVSTASLNIEAPSHFSAYAEQCYADLEKSELVSDQILAYLCHFQHIVEQFSAERSSLTKMYARRRHRSSVSALADRYPGADGLGYVAYWDEQLMDKWKAIPDNAKTKVVLSEYCYARVYLHDSCLEPLLLSSDEARLKVVYGCLEALKSFNDAMLPLCEEPHALLDIPSHSYSRSNHSMFVALQLCSLKCGDLSANIVEAKLNLTHVFGSVADKVAALMESTPQNSVPNWHRRIIPMAKAIQQGIAARMGTINDGAVDLGNDCESTAPESQVDFEFLEQFLNTDDNLWLQRLLAADDF